MDNYRVELVAMFAAALGESAESTRLIARIPSMLDTLSNLIVDHVASQVSKQFVDQVEASTGGKVEVHIKQRHDDIGIVGSLLDKHLLPTLREDNKEVLDSAEAAAERLNLPPRWAAKVRRVKETLEVANAETIRIQVQGLLEDFCEELREPAFLCIPASRRHYYEQRDPPFGQVVADKFPDSARDIGAASRCLALDEWTACVFHLMRALESPLKQLCSRVGVSFSGPTELENWKNIIDSIESNINDRVKRGEQQRKSLERNETLKQYAALALTFRHFKNAWRNSVAHGRDHYDEREAQLVYDGCKDFMQMMAAVVELPLPGF